MKALRTIAAVIAGYILFALGSMLIVTLLVAMEGWMAVVVALVGLVVIGLICGFTTSAVSGPTGRLAGSIVAALVALATLANLLMRLGAEPTWYKVATLVLTVTVILLVTARSPRQPRDLS